MLDKIRVLIGALPAKLALLQSILTAATVQVVPLLPENLAVRAGAVLVAVSGWVAFAVRVVSAVTPLPGDVPPEATGLMLPAGKQMRVEVVGRPWPAGHIHPD